MGFCYATVHSVVKASCQMRQVRIMVGHRYFICGYTRPKVLARHCHRLIPPCRQSSPSACRNRTCESTDIGRVVGRRIMRPHTKLFSDDGSPTLCMPNSWTCQAPYQSVLLNNFAAARIKEATSKRPKFVVMVSGANRVRTEHRAKI